MTHGRLFFMQKNRKRGIKVMKINENKMKEAQERALEILQTEEDKSQAIINAMEVIQEAQYDEIIKEIQEQSALVDAESNHAKELGLRVLSAEEKKFYEAFRDVKQSFSGGQIDLMPTSIIDVTLEDIKEDGGLLSHIEFAPAGVKKWLAASKSGAFSWGGLTDKIKGELTAAAQGVNLEISKLTVYMIIPKSIRDLALPFVDKYCRAVLKEQITEGLENGVLVGTGKDEPIGIYKKNNDLNQDGTHQDKAVNENLIRFTPRGVAPVKKYLTKNGTRKIDKIVIVCHPNDEADYVAPALYDDEGRLVASYKNLEVVTSCQNPQGKAAAMLPKKYTMGLSAISFKDYDQTLAMDDNDVIIGKAYANGRAVDDNVAFIFDVTKLEEYIKPVRVVGTVMTQAASDSSEQASNSNEQVAETTKFTITYNANGGTGSIGSVEVDEGESVTLSDGTGLTAPEGKEFKGWAKSSSAQNPTVTSPYTPEADTTLYAVWGDEQ